MQARITALVAGSPALLDTLNELAAALGNDPNFATTMTNALALKAPLNSPAFTGAPVAPTAAASDNSNKLATTAYADAAVAALNTLLTAALALKAPLASPAFTGTPTTATPAALGDSSTKIPNTAFVAAAVAASGAGTVKKNYLGNPAMQVSQRNGTAAGSASGYYPADRYQRRIECCRCIGRSSGKPDAGRIAEPHPRYGQHGGCAVASTDYAIISHYIEGAEFADLQFGTAGAHSVTKRFGVRAPAGIYCVAIRNQATNRAIVGEVTISAGEANTDVIKTVTLTGDTSGTWLNGIGQTGAVVSWCLMAGTNLQVGGAAGSWSASGGVATNNQFNFMGTVGNVFELFDVGMYDGASAPTWQKPDIASEMRECQRFWESTYTYGTPPGTATLEGADQVAISLSQSWGASGKGYQFRTTKCKLPNVTAYSPGTGAAGKMYDAAAAQDVVPTIANVGANGFRWLATPFALPQVYSLTGHLVIDASLT